VRQYLGEGGGKKRKGERGEGENQRARGLGLRVLAYSVKGRGGGSSSKPTLRKRDVIEDWGNATRENLTHSTTRIFLGCLKRLPSSELGF